MQLSKRLVGGVILIGLCLFLSGPAASRALYDIDGPGGGAPYPKPTINNPNTQFNVHKIGKIAMTITNFGTLGTGYLGTPVFEGELAPSCQYPTNSDIEYLFAGAIWIGAVIGRDTLVSVGVAQGRRSGEREWSLQPALSKRTDS